MTSIPTVVDNPSDGRYELRIDGDVVGSAAYDLVGPVLSVNHVETDPAHQGKGFAALLMDGVVDDVRARSLSIRPRCTYAAKYMRERPQTHDLYAA